MKILRLQQELTKVAQVVALAKERQRALEEQINIQLLRAKCITIEIKKQRELQIEAK